MEKVVKKRDNDRQATGWEDGTESDKREAAATQLAAGEEGRNS